MDATRASLTALATSLMRALHTRLDSPALIDDFWGDRLVLDEQPEARNRGSFSRAAVDGERRPLSAAAARRRSRRAPSLCPSPAASRLCDRDGPRGRSLNIIQRQLGHTDLGVTSTYLQGIDNAEIVNAVHARRAPMMPASAGLRL